MPTWATQADQLAFPAPSPLPPYKLLVLAIPAAPDLYTGTGSRQQAAASRVPTTQVPNSRLRQHCAHAPVTRPGPCAVAFSSYAPGLSACNATRCRDGRSRSYRDDPAWSFLDRRASFRRRPRRTATRVVSCCPHAPEFRVADRKNRQWRAAGRCGMPLRAPDRRHA